MIKLIGVLIVIVGFALRINPIAIVLSAGIVTGLVGHMSIVKILETIGKTFIVNRNMSLFLILLPIISVLEKNGLKEVATKLISKVKQATPGRVVLSYGIFRSILAAFNISLGGVVGFVRPVIQPMAEGSIETRTDKINEEDIEDIKGMGSAMENIAWFFGQVLFLGGSGLLLVKNTLDPLGYKIDPLQAVKAEIPVLLCAIIVSGILFTIKDRKIMKKYPLNSTKAVGSKTNSKGEVR